MAEANLLLAVVTWLIRALSIHLGSFLAFLHIRPAACFVAGPCCHELLGGPVEPSRPNAEPAIFSSVCLPECLLSLALQLLRPALLVIRPSAVLDGANNRPLQQRL